MAPECVQVKIEIGHKSVCRTDKTEEGYTHDWVVFVRGFDGSYISHFVEKVVFHLHESFPKPKRVIKLPPYKVEESGYGSFLLVIEIYFRNKEEPKKVKFDYDLYLQLVGNPPVTNVRVEVLTFTDPVEDFKKKLLKGGGVIVSSAGMNPPSSSSPLGVPALPPVTKPDAPVNTQPTFSPPTASPPPPPSAKNPKKSSPSTPVQPTTTPASKPPKLKDKDTTVQNSSMGVKRSNNDEAPTTQKLKKKKLDKSGDGTPKIVPKEVSIIGQSDEKSKAKSTAPATRKSEDIKERRKSSDATGTGEKAKLVKGVKDSKKEGGKELKGKDVKEKVKKDKNKKTEEKSAEEPKVQKLTVKRTSTDAWSSITKNATNQSKVDALMNEFGADGSESELEDIGEPSFAANSKDSSEAHSGKAQPTKTKKGSKVKSASTGLSNSEHLKMNGSKKKETPSPQNGKTVSDSNPLQELWRRISTTEDRDTLQKIVDIVESTGKFEVTDSTFDFDLCCLDSATVDRLRESLAIR